MPSYPGSVISFTVKTAGQNIDPAHINDAQSEIEAIEAGLLNGTARLNSSASTLASLSVSGNSTFANRPIAPPPDAVQVVATSTGTWGSSQFSTLSWLAQEFATNSSLHSTATNPERLTPQSTGLYKFTAQVLVASPSSLVRGLGVLDSSGLAIGYSRTANSTNLVLNVSGYKRFDVVGGYLTCRVEGDGATTNSFSTGLSGTWFAMHKL